MFLFSCQNKSAETNESSDKAQLNDSLKATSNGMFNNEQLYLVTKVHEDSIDASGNKYSSVEMKNLKNELYHSSGVGDYKIGDSVWIGKNEAGEYLVTRSYSTK